jgi:hypothetical protein
MIRKITQIQMMMRMIREPVSLLPIGMKSASEFLFHQMQPFETMHNY